MSTKVVEQFINDESGQGITEYGAILALVAMLIAMLFTEQGQLSSSINKAFNAIATSLNAVST